MQRSVPGAPKGAAGNERDSGSIPAAQTQISRIRRPSTSSNGEASMLAWPESLERVQQPSRGQKAPGSDTIRLKQ